MATRWMYFPRYSTTLLKQNNTLARNIFESALTGRKNFRGDSIHCIPSVSNPPAGTNIWICGWSERMRAMSVSARIVGYLCMPAVLTDKAVKAGTFGSTPFDSQHGFELDDWYLILVFECFPHICGKPLEYNSFPSCCPFLHIQGVKRACDSWWKVL